MAENGRPTWRDLVQAIDELRESTQTELRRVSARLTALEVQQASTAGAQNQWRWVVALAIPFLISAAAIVVTVFRA